MKISSRSTSPTSLRRSWRCVPSEQSKRIRSPPRRTSVAGSARRAVGIDPDVPRKTTSRSTAADCTRALKVDLVRADTGRMRRFRVFRPSGVGRPLTLLRTFLVASAVILALGAVALSSRLSGDLRSAALEDSARDTMALSDAVLAPPLVRGNAVVVTPTTARRLLRTLRLPADMRGLNVYGQDGRLVFSTNHPERLGRRRASPDLRAALESNEPSAHIVDPRGDAPRLVRVWAPVRDARGRAVGVAEVA